MLEVGPADESGSADEAADLGVFVDRLAAAGTDRPTALARVQIRRAISAGASPPGVRRLAEALAAAVDRTTSPRRPATHPGTIAAEMRTNNLVVLEGFDASALGDSIDGLLADGKRVVITGSDQRLIDSVRRALPSRTAGRVLDQLPELACGDLRELRSLLATSTPARRARGAQQLPAAADLRPPAEVEELCRQARRVAEPGPGAAMVPALLSAVDSERLAAVTAVAHLVDRSLRSLPPAVERGWAWRLLSDLVLSQHRAVFDGLLEDIAQAVAAVDRGRDAIPVTFTSRPDTGTLGLLRQYRDFLAGGGRCRSYFRSGLQREAEPVLAEIRVDGQVPASEADLSRVVSYLELGEWLRRVCAGCVEIGVPAPRDDGELRSLHATLLRVAAAVRSVSALRHDVLFLGTDSPLSVPDVESAGAVAAAVLEYETFGSGFEAGRRLDALAAQLESRCPAGAASSELDRVCSALRERDAATYAQAVEELVAARREQRDELRRTALLQRLSAGAPGLAAAWCSLAEHSPAALGMAVFLPLDGLLAQIPPPDSADVVLVLGAAALGVEHLLLTAVAPRMIAAIGPDERPGAAPTLLSVLQRAAALVISLRSGSTTAATVVPISAATPPRVARPAVVGQVGA